MRSMVAWSHSSAAYSTWPKVRPACCISVSVRSKRAVSRSRPTGSIAAPPSLGGAVDPVAAPRFCRTNATWKSGAEHHAGGRSCAPRKGCDARGEIGRELEAERLAAVGTDRGPRAVGGQLQERRSAVELRLPPLHLPRERLAREPFALAHGVIAV